MKIKSIKKSFKEFTSTFTLGTFNGYVEWSAKTPVYFSVRDQVFNSVGEPLGHFIIDVVKDNYEKRKKTKKY